MEPGMDVCDRNGDKIGTVAHVYRHEMAPVAAGAGGPMGSSQGLPEAMPGEFLEVKTGLFGLGRRLYIPMSQVQDLTSGCVFLMRGRDEIDDLDWDMRPDHLDQLT